MTPMDEIFRKHIPRYFSNARCLTRREALLLRDHGIGRTTRSWIVWRDDAGTVTLGRPTLQLRVVCGLRRRWTAGGPWELHRVY